VTRPGRSGWPWAARPDTGGWWPVGSLAGSGGAREMPDRARPCHDPLAGGPLRELVVCVYAPGNPSLRGRIWQRLPDSRGVRAGGRIWG